MSEQVPVYIKEVAVVDFKGFRGKHSFSFVDHKGEWCQWTVFLGNNNTGKTNLLKAIASLEPKFVKHTEIDNIERSSKEYGVYTPIGHHLDFCPIDSELGIEPMPIYYSNLKTKVVILSGILVSDENYDSKISKSLSYNYNKAAGLIPDYYGAHSDYYFFFKIYGYGVLRTIEKEGISNKDINRINADNLFFGTNLINFEDWLFQLDYAAKNGQEKAKQRRDILKTVLTSEIFPEINDLRFISDENLNNYIEFETTDGWHRMSELGYGYQSTLAWMADFCKKLFDRYPDSPNPLKEPAVLLIDEIDLHLHPQWQRELIKSLSGIFPKTQFIVTTHSPFIIQSMENVNLYTLNRVGDQTKVKHLGNRSYIGWKIEEILGEVMGLEEKIHTDRYNELMAQFDAALDTDDYTKGKAAYDQLMQILHPQSAERKLLDIQFTQLAPEDDKA